MGQGMKRPASVVSSTHDHGVTANGHASGVNSDQPASVGQSVSAVDSARCENARDWYVHDCNMLAALHADVVKQEHKDKPEAAGVSFRFNHASRPFPFEIPPISACFRHESIKQGLDFVTMENGKCRRIAYLADNTIHRYKPQKKMADVAKHDAKEFYNGNTFSVHPSVHEEVTAMYEGAHALAHRHTQKHPNSNGPVCFAHHVLLPKRVQQVVNDNFHQEMVRQTEDIGKSKETGRRSTWIWKPWPRRSWWM